MATSVAPIGRATPGPMTSTTASSTSAATSADPTPLQPQSHHKSQQRLPNNEQLLTASNANNHSSMNNSGGNSQSISGAHVPQQASQHRVSKHIGSTGTGAGAKSKPSHPPNPDGTGAAPQQQVPIQMYPQSKGNGKTSVPGKPHQPTWPHQPQQHQQQQSQKQQQQRATMPQPQHNTGHVQQPQQLHPHGIRQSVPAAPGAGTRGHIVPGQGPPNSQGAATAAANAAEARAHLAAKPHQQHHPRMAPMPHQQHSQQHRTQHQQHQHAHQQQLHPSTAMSSNMNASNPAAPHSHIPRPNPNIPRASHHHPQSQHSAAGGPGANAVGQTRGSANSQHVQQHQQHQRSQHQQHQQHQQHRSQHHHHHHHAQHQHQQQHQQQQQKQHSSQAQTPNASNTSNNQSVIPNMPSQTSLLSHSSSTGAANPHTPLYERLVSEEVKEFKEYVRLIEHQSRRLLELEKIHHDLEHRLEEEHLERQRLEYTLEMREKGWKAKCDLLQKEKEDAERLVKEEKTKVEKLLDMMNRLQNEIQSMIKNKFSHPVGSHHLHGNITSVGSLTTLGATNSAGLKRSPSGQPANANSGSSSNDKKTGSGHVVNRDSSSPGDANARNDVDTQQSTTRLGRHIGPHEILAYNGSVEVARERNVFSCLFDFFGM